MRRSFSTASKAAALLCAIILSQPAARAANCVGSCGVYDACRTPAKGVEMGRWGAIEPTDSGALPSTRDSTDFDELGGWTEWENNAYFESVDVEEGWAFTSANRQLAIWEVTTPAKSADPLRRSVVNVSTSGLQGTTSSHPFYVFRDLDAPPDDADVLAVTGIENIGVAIYDTSIKTEPRLVYQDYGGSGHYGEEIYATKIGNSRIAFAAGELGGAGVRAYNLDNAVGFGAPCFEQQPAVSCPGVHIRSIGSRSRAYHIDGSGNFIVFSSRHVEKGFEIWNVGTPSLPMQVMTGLPSSDVHGVALWEREGSYYLALTVRVVGAGSPPPNVTHNEMRIYNVSCITSGSCSLGSPLYTLDLPASSEATITYSESENIPFLYIAPGGNSGSCPCQDGGNPLCSPTQQVEFLLDVTTPSAPIDLSPGADYWYWYYHSQPTGFNRVSPRRGKFGGRYFYRAAKTIFDVHRRVNESPPIADFSWTPAQVYPDTPIQFTDESLSGPTGWAWDFDPNGSPPSSSVKNPGNVTFPNTGAKTVTLMATNGNGMDTEVKNLQVLAPEPMIASVSASPNPAQICQIVALTGNGVSGEPPLSLVWHVRQSGVLKAQGAGTSFAWNTEDCDPGAGTTLCTAGLYVARLTATNGSGSLFKTVNVNLSAPPALPIDNSFFPTYDGQPSSPEGGTAQFHAPAIAGAFEWSWDFDDGEGFGPWNDNPISGPNPVHTFQQIDTYNVRVKVRNCIEEATSGPVIVDVDDLLHIDTFANDNCFIICEGAPGQQMSFDQSFTGAPEVYEYDWEGNGTFEEISAVPILAHTFLGVGQYDPSMRVRAGLAVDEDEHFPAIRIRIPPDPGPIDRNEPDMPTGAAATTSGVDVLVSWTPPATGFAACSGADPADCGYRIYRNDNSNTYVKPPDFVVTPLYELIGAVTEQETTFLDVFPPSLSTLKYLVVAFNNGGEGVPSSNAMAQTLDPIFTDGFESGSMSAWSSKAP